MIYEPAEDSYLLEKEVKKYSKNKSFLDMGAGSGIQSIAARQARASSILAADINQKVISHLKNMDIPCIKSNLFDKIKGKFDLIAFNPPYLPEDKREDDESKAITTGGKKGDEIILDFLKQAKSHMNPKGTILLLVSSLTPKNRIDSILKKQNLRKKTISSEKMFMESIEVWEIKSA